MYKQSRQSFIYLRKFLKNTRDEISNKRVVNEYDIHSILIITSKRKLYTMHAQNVDQHKYKRYKIKSISLKIKTKSLKNMLIAINREFRQSSRPCPFENRACTDSYSQIPHTSLEMEIIGKATYLDFNSSLLSHSRFVSISSFARSLAVSSNNFLASDSSCSYIDFMLDTSRVIVSWVVCTSRVSLEFSASKCRTLSM